MLVILSFMKLKLIWKYFWPALKKRPVLNSLPYIFILIAIVGETVLLPLTYKWIVDGIEEAVPSGAFALPESIAFYFL